MTQSQSVYIYDGSFDGLLCGIFRAYELKEEPADICVSNNTLLPCMDIETDEERARRVKRWIKKSFGSEFEETIMLCYLSRESGAEADILRYVRLAEKKGKTVQRDLCDPLVYRCIKRAKSVRREAHRIIEFLRFSDYQGNLVSVINPKHFILPLISRHFEQRYPNENYFIYDEVNGAALSHENGKTMLFPVESFTAAEPTQEEQKFRTLWKLFYDTIEIKERHNAKLRIQHLPKRFWKNVTELCGEL